MQNRAAPAPGVRLHWHLFPVAGFDGPEYVVLPATALALALAAVAASARSALEDE